MAAAMTVTASTETRRVLVVGGSAAKHPVPPDVRVPAWDLYNGMGFRLMKQLEREGLFPADVDVWILSAAHGLIRRADRILPYDGVLNNARAAALAEPARTRLRYALDRARAKELFVFGTRPVAHCLGLPALQAEKPALKIGVAKGGGVNLQLAQLRTWLIIAEANPELQLG